MRGRDDSFRRPQVWLAFACIALTLTGEAGASTRDDARSLVVAVRGDNISGAGVIFALRLPFVYVVTANHVIRRGHKVYNGLRVGFLSWPGESLPAIALDTWNEALDLAVLRVDLTSRNFPHRFLPKPADAAYIDPRSLKPGAPMYPVGHPERERWFVPGDPVPVYKVSSFEIDIEFGCGEGHSGGALFDADWRLAGILLKSNNFVCTAVSLETVVAELERWNYPIDFQNAASLGALDSVSLAIVVVGPSGRADSGAGFELAARLVQSGFAAEVLDVTPRELSSLQRGQWPMKGLPGGYLLVAEMGKLNWAEDPIQSGGKTARLGLDVKILSAAGQPFAAFRALQSGFGFSEQRAAAAARDRAFAELVRQTREQLP